MRVKVAQGAGFCFGVKMAIQKENYDKITAEYAQLKQLIFL